MSRQVRNLDGEGVCHLQPGLPWTRGLGKSEMPGEGTEVALLGWPLEPALLGQT